MDRECNCSLPTKVDGKCVNEGKFQEKMFNLYEIKCSMCEAIYIGNTQQKFKKILDVNLFYLLCLLKSVIKPDSFADHSKQHFNSYTTCTDLRNCI